MNLFDEILRGQGGSGGGGGGNINPELMIIDLTFLEGGDDETGEYPVALSKSFDEIQTAYENGVALFVRDGILYQVTGLDDLWLTCAGLWINSTGTQSRMMGIEMVYKQDGTWDAIPMAPLLYEPGIVDPILHIGNRKWVLEVDDDGQVIATAYSNK